MSDTTPLYDSLESGIAVLSDDTDSVAGDGPWTVNGVALPEDTMTVGQSGQPRFWPGETLADAADELQGRPIVKNFHDLDGQAPADDVIGRVTDTGYADGVGLIYEGEISDEAIAKKVERGYLDVSVVPSIADESYDSTLDARRVEDIASFRDIAVVAEGAAEGADIELGPNPSVAALSRNLLAEQDVFDGLSAGSDTGVDADVEADAGGESADSDGEGDVEAAADAGTDGEGESDATTDGEGDTGDGVDDSVEGLTDALKRELTTHTPDRCRTIKDGSKTIDATTNPVARDVLGVTGSQPRDVRDDPVARQVVGIDDDAAEEPVEADTVDIESDDMARGAIGLDPGTEASDDAPEPEPEPDVIDLESDAVARSALDLPTEVDIDVDEVERGDFALSDGDDEGTVDVSSDVVARSALDLPVDMRVAGGDGDADGEGESAESDGESAE